MKEKYFERACSYATKSARSTISPIFGKDGKPIYVPLPVEQRFAKEFNNKRNGWPASDISRLISSSSVLELQQLFNRMSSTPVSNSGQKDLTVEQKYLACKPRWCDTPSERQRFMDYVFDQSGLSEQDLFRLSSDNQTSTQDASKSSTADSAQAD